MKNKTTHFTKMHGNGNDFIIIDEYHESVVTEHKKSSFAGKYCNRRTGIGADGVLYLYKSDKADIGMRIFQPDQSEAEMCGNGIRCLVKYAVDVGYVGIGEVSVETLAGVKHVKARSADDSVFLAQINMGKPMFKREDIPATGSGELLEEELEGYTISAVNTDVPHTVIFMDDIKQPPEPLEILGRRIRFNPIFPQGANVNLAEKQDTNTIRIRTYERGVEAETPSCGTGAVACAAVARRLGLINSDSVLVITSGGELKISFKDDEASMEGPAETVYHGIIE